MRHRPLGTRSVTAIGSGDVRLGLAASRGLDSRDVTAGLHTALGLGLTIIDVGDEQDAERLAGDAVRSMRLRDTVIVATRVPLVPPLPGAPKRDVLSERLPPRYVQERIEATLRATHLDALALAQLPILPAWRDSSAWPELAGMCARLVREGKVMSWGAIVDELTGADALVAEPWLVSLHLTFNACTRDALPLIQAARTETARAETVHGQATPRTVTILARQPLAGAALAGTLGPGVALVPRDD
ncbi:MAG: aldo/keto reductase, partial [Myxococcota bacterium]|nr:aldo/keto reductase [Myxococcota bacterium]